MLKIRQWFYDKAKKNTLKEMEQYGIRIIDEDKFHKRLLVMSKSDMIYSIIFLIVIIGLIIKWVMRL